MTGCVPDPEPPPPPLLWGSCKTKAGLQVCLDDGGFEMLACVVPEDVFIVPIVTSPDQRCHVSLCSPRVSVHTAPRGHDYSVSPFTASAPSLCSSPPSVHLFLELVI